jgi:hypothetical protein
MEPMPKEPNSRTVTVTSAERPARKLILLSSLNATDYLTFCEEMGCDWEGRLNSVAEKFDKAALLTVPPNLRMPGAGPIAAGVKCRWITPRRFPTDMRA